jgi:hypothetical protein
MPVFGPGALALGFSPVDRNNADPAQRIAASDFSSAAKLIQPIILDRREVRWQRAQPLPCLGLVDVLLEDGFLSGEPAKDVFLRAFYKVKGVLNELEARL